VYDGFPVDLLDSVNLPDHSTRYMSYTVPSRMFDMVSFHLPCCTKQ
jgi:hypothetical protein